MISVNKKVHSLYGGILAGVLCASPVMADDTEIYLGSNDGMSTINPNIVFIIDNSGSMDALVTTQSTYNPAINYAGSCNDSRVYWTSGSTNPSSSSCGSYVNLSNFHCQAGKTTFATAGVYTDIGAQYRSNAWNTIDNQTSNVECKADNGIHGNGGAATYPTNSSSQWSTTQTNNFWNGKSNYTFRTGNFRNWQLTGGSTQKQRLDIVKEAVYQLVQGLNNVNIGLMYFDDDDGSGGNQDGGLVGYAVEDVATAKVGFLAALNALGTDTYTPLSETLYEAALYYRGDDVLYGNISEPAHSVAASRTTGTISGPKYKSPITAQCQKSFIVYLTDGDPTQDSGVSSSMMGNITAAGTPTKPATSTSCNTFGSGTYKSNCLDDIAYRLATQDQSTAFIKDQYVNTYTIGFGTGLSAGAVDLLKSAALQGGGLYKPASDTSDLINVFTNIIGNILQTNSTFSSPAVSVNAFNRSTHLDHLYFSLFKPANGPHWDGNFKRYKLDFDDDGNAKIVDVGGNAAINDTSGYFETSARSYWTPDTSGWKENSGETDKAPDGSVAPKGGVASVLKVNRNVYTYTGSQMALTDSSNALSNSNSVVTQGMLGVGSAAERTNLLNWVRGTDVKDEDGDGNTTEPRKVMGDPLHGEPALITYGGTNLAPDITAYVPTNDGYLHAFKTSNGEETFAFVPNELLGNLKTYYDADPGVVKKYGLDGSVTSWVTYTNPKDVSLGVSKAYIYFGMRRGGNNYYALDVTNRNAPVLKWVIKGGTGGTSGVAGFGELSQSWSQPQLRKIRFNNVDRHVLIFGGGYDESQDAHNSRQVDSTGRAIYIVDAESGDRLWWASSLGAADLTLPDMKYSIPSNVSAIDADGDGYADKIYVGDMGGQLWRFDIAKGGAGTTITGIMKGGRIAEFAADSVSADNRRFYYPPSVALVKNKNDSGDHNLALVMTSGFRAHPLDTLIKDRIYVVMDKSVSGSPGTYTTLTEADLVDATAGGKPNKNGWYVRLTGSGEKGMAKAFIFSNKIYYTSYIPKDGTGTSCEPNEGSGILYVMNMPGVGDDGDDVVISDIKLKRPGIPPDAKIIITDNEKQKDPALCVATECFTEPNPNAHQKLYWFER